MKLLSESAKGNSKRNRNDRGKLLSESAKGGRRSSRRDVASGNMSAAQALEILGINAGANEQDIRAAYNHLMKRVHPDVGGSEFFSKQLNAARDVLLG